MSMCTVPPADGSRSPHIAAWRGAPLSRLVRAPDRVGARQALAGTGVRIGSIPHPSPASPAANRGWEQLAAAAFLQLGVAI
jgi:hypothetical protein